MYTLSKNLKLIPIILMVVGAIGLAIGFVSAPSTIEEVKEHLAASHHDDHGASHAPAATHDSHAHGGDTHADHKKDAHGHGAAEAGHDAHGGDKHYEHVLHQLQNKPWAALYVAAFFFFMIALGVLAFYAIQFAAQAGWSPLLLRVMEGITAYLLPGGIILFVILALSGFHMNHLFVWMDPEVVAHDELIQGKSGWLNVPFFLIRAAIYIGVWSLYRHFAVKYSRNQDESPEGNVWYKKSFKLSAVFLVFFIYSESMMSWDWIMSFDPHWFSTLFGWYVFASLFVSGITVIALVTIYLKSKGYLEQVNNSHIHDLAKFMFGISVFWTYLWFSQFMLIWYSNIPEEVTYFITRINDYKLPFFGMLIMNFLFPVLVMINTDYKRINWIVVMAGIVILLGHYVDVYNMVMPATVGQSWFIGISEISAVLLFLGIFIFVVFNALTKAPLVPKGNPLLGESKHFHY
ncbi:quinol:cytochrome C oxidoreductase [Aquimarina agarivorans]|uniref:quinol:cytochrome C oxidoreductase n=1 Tax=Aquimarina agarivorans TaxID=980584 RepID=UPI000248FCB7|nr:quinol:cytochrome C oxidoreductase [Aquimarina agarivorans]